MKNENINGNMAVDDLVTVQSYIEFARKQRRSHLLVYIIYVLAYLSNIYSFYVKYLCNQVTMSRCLITVVLTSVFIVLTKDVVCVCMIVHRLKTTEPWEKIKTAPAKIHVWLTEYPLGATAYVKGNVLTLCRRDGKVLHVKKDDYTILSLGETNRVWVTPAGLLIVGATE